MKRFLALLGVLVCAASAWGQGNSYQPQLISYTGPPPAQAVCDVYQVALDVTRGSFYSCNPTTRKWTSSGAIVSTVTKLPSAASAGIYTPAEITDGSSASDCTVGGGSHVVLCYSTGTIWTAFTASASGLPSCSSLGVTGPCTPDGTSLTIPGPSPWTDITASPYNARAIASPQTITVTTSAGSPTVTTTGIGDFQAEDGIAIPAAGATTSQSTPSAPTIAVRGATGAATINYECVGVDRQWGLTAASAAGTTTTAPAPFGWAAVGITSVARATNVVTVTASATLPVSSGSYSAVIANVTGGTTQFSGLQSVTVTSGTTLTYSQTGANESGTVTSASYILFENAYILTTVAATAGSNQLVLTTSVNHNIIAGDATRPTKIFLDGINFSGESPAGFANGVFPVLSVTANTITIQTSHTAVATANGAASLSLATSAVAQMTATVIPIVDVSCPAIGGTTVYYAVYGNYGSGYAPIGFTPFNTKIFEDYGPAYSQTGFTPPPAMALPATPPASAQRQVFAGQISSIVSTTLTLSGNVTAGVTSVTAYHDEGTAFLAALVANPWTPLFLPAETFGSNATYVFNAPVDVGAVRNGPLTILQAGSITANGTLYFDDVNHFNWIKPEDLNRATQAESGQPSLVTITGNADPLMTAANFSSHIKGIEFTTISEGQVGLLYQGNNPSTLEDDGFNSGTLRDLTALPLLISNGGFSIGLRDIYFNCHHDVEYPVAQSGQNVELGQAAWWPVPCMDVIGPQFPVITLDGTRNYGLVRGLQIDDALYNNTGNSPQITVSQIQTFQDPWQPMVQVWGDSGARVTRLSMNNVQMDSVNMPNGACISVDGLSCVVTLTTDSQRGGTSTTWSGSPSNSAFEIVDLNEFPAQNTNETYLDSGGNLHTTNSVAASGVPTLTGTQACLTASLASRVGGAWAGRVQCTGTTGTSTLVIAPGVTAPNFWECDGSDGTAGTTMAQSGFSATTCTLTGTVTSNDFVTFKAVAY